ncbi:hypothetical protein Vretimale_19904 [Volvox reticuliferus]|uniref:Uncharacterized protein n=1 Tax=Volvox reticuliferus TaxID=1737510 RepID=A0A8J4M0P8_9CHLO|nr:hypothetical protein Vretimale_19904 [Volvox reticuliferus]
MNLKPNEHTTTHTHTTHDIYIHKEAHLQLALQRQAAAATAAATVLIIKSIFATSPGFSRPARQLFHRRRAAAIHQYRFHPAFCNIVAGTDTSTSANLHIVVSEPSLEMMLGAMVVAFEVVMVVVG